MYAHIYVYVYIDICKGKDSFLSPHPSHSLPEEPVVSISASRNHTHTSRLIYCSLFSFDIHCKYTHAHTHTHTHSFTFLCSWWVEKAVPCPPSMYQWCTFCWLHEVRMMRYSNVEKLSQVLKISKGPSCSSPVLDTLVVSLLEDSPYYRTPGNSQTWC